jgi:hypothetical protein
MANPTNPFNWQMPTSTDLVTDLPADFETFGQAVATSMADLLGGTTGQILSKASNTDMDFTWVTNDVGDITAVTAGTGISGGGTSGAVTITNSMATEITASGDIIVGTGSGTFDNLPIGTTGQVLTADTTVSPYKVKWATPASSTPTFVGAKVFKSAAQSIPNATWTTLTFDSESFDTDAFHSTSTNTSRITIPSGKAGKYSVQWQVVYVQNSTGNRNTRLTVNGSNAAYGTWINAVVGDPTSISASALLNLSAGDYVELLIGQGSGGALDASGNEAVGCTLAVTYLGA